MRYTFVIDLDGTLLQNDGELHIDASNYLVQLQEMGHTVVIATGRKYIEAEKFLKQLKLQDYKSAAILSDGQYLLDYRDNTEISAQFLMYPDDYIEIMGYFDKMPETIKLMAMEQDYDVFPSVFCFALWKRFFRFVMKFHNPFRGLLVSSNRKIEHIEKITVKPHKTNICLNASANERYQVAFVNDKERYEFKSKAVNKSEMLKKYLAKYDISEDYVFVFGNDENDLCMFDDFSNSFVVNTARENVKKRAREVVPHCEGLGIIKKIKEIVEED